ncbi:MAG: Asp-tRNA(Asn)/Glu-tRNA(Gln) amidotransferase subunit GatC [Betaproteobacteria bacterium]|nr:Asp-tRNA(Asn)/Glu-tRNA(Gln) amidotransferase subunit GatC [Betaproteobacteria bacterium]
MSLDHDQIRRIARLARIAISDTEAAATSAQLNGVLHLIEEMRSVDTTGIEPMSHALEAQLSIVQRLREDQVTENDRHAEFQAVAPAVEAGLYLVPKVIE